MTGIKSKDSVLDDIIYLATRAKENTYRKNFSMQTINKIRYDLMIAVRTDKLVGL